MSELIKQLAKVIEYYLSCVYVSKSCKLELENLKHLNSDLKQQKLID